MTTMTTPKEKINLLIEIQIVVVSGCEPREKLFEKKREKNSWKLKRERELLFLFISIGFWFVPFSTLKCSIIA